MAGVDFIDQVKIFVRAGHGGAGSRHFRRERFIPKGGPDGGNGGRGGHIILHGNPHLTTLLDFRYRKHLVAPHGIPGKGNQQTGANAEDLMIDVPLGTVVKTEEGIVKGEITQHGEKLMVAKGGRGGLGNTHFKSPSNQAPQFAQPGEQGEHFTLLLELKLLADVGLVGLPNAGKSTLLSVLSAARPKIGHYAFTTLVPNLGVVSYQPQQSFVMADIPGIIQGAAQGKGLGTRFLRHIERTKVLLFLISSEHTDINATYQMLQKELQAHNPALCTRPHLLAINKIDLLTPTKLAQRKKTLPPDIPFLAISGLKKQGLVQLKRHLWQLLHPATATTAPFRNHSPDKPHQ